MTVEEIEILVTAKVEEALKEIQKMVPAMKKAVKDAQEAMSNIDTKALGKKINQAGVLVKKKIQDMRKSAENNKINLTVNNKEAQKQISQIQKQIDSLNEKINARQMKLNIINPQIDKIVEDTRNTVVPDGISKNDKSMDTVINNSLSSNKDFTTLSNQAQKLYTEIEMYNKQLNEAKSKMSELGQQISQTATTQNKLSSFFSSFKQKIEQTKPSLSNLKNNFKGLPKITQNITNNIKGMGKGLKQGLGHVLKYAGALFSLRGIYSVLSNSASSWLSSQNAQAQQLSSNIEYMKYSMGSVFAPIIEYVVNLVYQLMRAIQSVVYAFSGINIFAKATASSMKNTSKNAKEAGKSLSGVHSEINNVSENNSSGGDGTVSPSFDLSQMSNTSNSILDAIKNGNWNELGTIIGQKLNEAMDKIPWNKIQDGARRISTGIVETLNGFISTTDWTQVGNTFAQGLNTVIYFGYSFITNFNWSNLGVAIGNMINGLFNNIDWSIAGQTIGEKVKGIITTISMFLETIDWQNIATQIQTFFENIDFSGISGTGLQIVINLLNGIIESMPIILATAVNIVSSLADGLTQQLPTLIPIAINAILTFVNSILQNLPTVINSAVQIIIAVVQGLVNALPVLISWLPTIIQSVVDIINNSLPQILEAGIQILIALINGLIKCIPKLVEMLPTIINTIITTLLNNLPLIINAGIQILIALIDGLARAIPELIEMLPEIISTIVSTLAQNFPKIIQAGGEILTSLIAGIGSFLYKVGEAGWDIIESIGNVLKELPSKAIEWGKDMIQGFIDGIKSMFSSIGNAVSSIGDKIKSFLHFSRPDEGPLRDYEKWMPDMVKGLTDTLNNSAPQLYNASKELAKKVASGLDISSMAGSMSFNTNILPNDFIASLTYDRPNDIQTQNIMRETIEDVFSDVISGNSNSGQPIRIQVYFGAKNVIDEVIDGINEKTRRTGKAQIKVGYA